MEKVLKNKIDSLRNAFADTDRILVAFSGGVDSTFLLTTLAAVGRQEVFAVTVKTPYIPQWEVDEALSLCKSIGIEHRIIKLPIPESIRRNPADRCYRCKKILFDNILKLAQDIGCNIIVDGSNADDTSDYRPGMKALKEMGIRSPLLEAGFTKKEIRSLLKERGLEIWNKPTYACLLTRIPYDTEIDEGTLHLIELAEKFLHDQGYKGARLRLHGDIARIECDTTYHSRLLQKENKDRIINYIKKLGISYITIDLEGYRTGSMNVFIQS